MWKTGSISVHGIAHIDAAQINQDLVLVESMGDAHVIIVCDGAGSAPHSKLGAEIVCGEVLEHVKNPNKLLNNINVFLNKNGKVFISTCINCPAIDHVNQFNKVEDITKLFKKSKFKIISQKILPVEKVNYTNALKKKITINYSAILKKN